jgi:CheY-like chemotaxis protein
MESQPRVTGEAHPLRILVIEDNPGDIRLITEAFRESSVPTEIHVAENGDVALAYLQQNTASSEAPKPDLILLDLNLPGTDGREVLHILRNDPALQDIPIVIMTSSRACEDVSQAVSLGVERFVRKPSDLDTYIALVQDLAAWWGPRVRTTDTPS